MASKVFCFRRAAQFVEQKWGKWSFHWTKMALCKRALAYLASSRLARLQIQIQCSENSSKRFWAKSQRDAKRGKERREKGKRERFPLIYRSQVLLSRGKRRGEREGGSLKGKWGHRHNVSTPRPSRSGVQIVGALVYKVKCVESAFICDDSVHSRRRDQRFSAGDG